MQNRNTQIMLKVPERLLDESLALIAIHEHQLLVALQVPDQFEVLIDRELRQ